MDNLKVEWPKKKGKSFLNSKELLLEMFLFSKGGQLKEGKAEFL